MTEAREHAAIFTGESVREILAGRKTQTRRPVKGLPDLARNVRRMYGYLKCDAPPGTGTVSLRIPCPYGWTEDRLWVKETHAIVPRSAYWHDPTIPHREQDGDWVIYREGWERAAPRWRSPIYMPRWASRLTLEITTVRVQRLRDITEGDAVAEGAANLAAFQERWEGIHGHGSWKANPYVWAITFRRTTA